ncbi:hypothetical protein AM1_C0145 (plasmid) [Acaryochloris marina MBIC11017]|uniref:Uncharacterized protein n=1 Tax=Acaryochloris marina (strain MBIC 11017) TaxID=329726 RepID=A8ZMP1_ACAM1|nr:hypothetical protein AM1_C0145 [Acaryochloris marina MBIC11017]
MYLRIKQREQSAYLQDSHDSITLLSLNTETLLTNYLDLNNFSSLRISRISA